MLQNPHLVSLLPKGSIVANRSIKPRRRGL